jgi:hypothetical protein
MPDKKATDWLYKNTLLINYVGLRSFTDKKMILSCAEKLNKLLTDSCDSLKKSGKKIYKWRDLREALTFQLLIPDYVTRNNYKGGENDD